MGTITGNDTINPIESFEGYISLWRKITHSFIWGLDLEEFKIAILCLLKANHTTKEWFNGSTYVTIERGSFITSRDKFAAEVGNGIRSDKVYNTWKKLIRAKFINTKSNNRYTTIFILNYNKYQLNFNNKTNNGFTTNSQQSHTTNNEDNDNKKIDKSITPLNGLEIRKRSGKPNPQVNFVLEEFTRIFQLEKPSDVKPRQWAYHISRKLEPEQITALFTWAYSQEWGMKTDKLATLYRKIPMFEREQGGTYATSATFDNPEWT